MSEMQRNIGKYERQHSIASEGNKLSEKIQLVGDVHGKFNQLLPILDSHTGLTIQLGDLGIGFHKGFTKYSGYAIRTHPEAVRLTNFEYDKDKFLFIRGNHDNPIQCRKHPNYLGEYGLIGKDDIFFISGAWSIDRAWRTPGVDWWEEEELSQIALLNAIESYSTAFPRIVISHDCPYEIAKIMYPREHIATRTGQAFDAMLDEWRPSMWIFGHHHTRKDFVHKGTRFICLDELQSFTIEGI